jgi:hypothetical protein
MHFLNAVAFDEQGFNMPTAARQCIASDFFRSNVAALLLFPCDRARRTRECAVTECIESQVGKNRYDQVIK